MITECSACATLFRVVPDQLRIADGWVRCGECGEVFDAKAQLLPQEDDASAALAPAAATAPRSAAQSSASDGQARGLPTGGEGATSPHPPVDVLIEDLGGAPRPSPAPTAAPGNQPEEPAPDSIMGPAEPAWYTEYKQSLGDSASADPAPFELDDPLDGPALEDVSFVREARARAFWESTTARLLLSVVVAALLLLLVAQVAVHQRDRLAALQPGLRPVLEALCRPAGCTLQPPRQIESIAIESSTFNRLSPSTYRLGFSMRNQASVPIATPWLELTLTDANEQPVLRRVLSPADLGAGQTAVLAAGGDWSSVLDFSVPAEPVAARIAGYRLLAFYP